MTTLLAMILGFTLIDADSDLPIPAFDPLLSGVTVDLALLPTRKLNVRANPQSGFTGSVTFGLDGNANFRTESFAPYALFGDSSGNYNAGSFSVGSHTITATQSDGPSLSITFSVIDSNPPPYFPPSESAGGWRRLVPRSAIPTAQQKADVLATCGLDWDTLHQAKLLSDQLTTSTTILVIRHGWICYEWGTTSTYLVHSVTKSFTGLAYGKLFDLGVTIPENFVHPYLPPAFGDSDPRKRIIAFNHMLNMSSGMAPWDFKPSLTLTEALNYPQSASPAVEWAYTSLGPNLLSVSLTNMTGQLLRSFFNSNILNPIGVPSISSSNWAAWNGYTMGAAGAKISARNIARIGYLLLHSGQWNGTPVLSALTVGYLTQWAPELETALLYNSNPPNSGDPLSHLYYGHLFWTNRGFHSFGPTVPEDAYAMQAGDMFTVVIPSLDVIVVRLKSGSGFDRQFVKDFMGLIAGAVVQ